jgi:hypothetical protein
MLIIMASQAHEMFFINHWPLLEFEWDIPLAIARPSAEAPTRIKSDSKHRRDLQA